MGNSGVSRLRNRCPSLVILFRRFDPPDIRYTYRFHLVGWGRISVRRLCLGMHVFSINDDYDRFTANRRILRISGTGFFQRYGLNGARLGSPDTWANNAVGLGRKTLLRKRIALESLGGRLGPYRSIEGNLTIVNHINHQNVEKEGLIRDFDKISIIWTVKLIPNENRYTYNMGSKSLYIRKRGLPLLQITAPQTIIKIFLLLRTISLLPFFLLSLLYARSTS